MTQQQHEQQAPTNQTLLLTPGSAAPLTYDHQWVFLHQGIPYSDPQAEALLEEEAVEDSQEEVTPEEEAVGDSQVVEDRYKVILKEDHRETD